MQPVQQGSGRTGTHLAEVAERDLMVLAHGCVISFHSFSVLLLGIPAVVCFAWG
ncbi:hypothetical protein SLNWT_3729 [Streptomyces albus]|uniref:Uncharacterized protein n=1 Tax=Streptomyces albus (strain ATCC 21838 / DSM 41398 / FERM P-419 / JCM 4703 / NBRC 107858) TaxID=1081613 RepID=A0A0B5EXZ5_STRA4|nr:hypothetical protein SLNWT_3729 [Streptomyces albus]AOU78410.1 hypothetical protein SLNHY_3719 [Streptomyces albus]AYN34160.1 hypothetical protein DUI70_3658 [Streptomyces albus]